ncbi:MAG: hypothetical protein HC810_00400 [Acaryochloridaceae cyanobacterium RL_2_7]|nr:hypothetical protein [Acaryochloridaceae cyanobacterium RL_2_7]
MAIEILNLQDQLQVLKSSALSQQFQQILTQKFRPALVRGVDVGQWWNHVLEDWSQQMGWITLPPVNLALRSSADEASDIVGRLCEQGIHIPEQAQASYQDLPVATQSIRLYAVTWPCEASPFKENPAMDWSLLLVLCTMPAAALSQSIQIQVRDEVQILATQDLLAHQKQACSFVQVSGSETEKFWVTLMEENQPETTLELPPFYFSHPDLS